MIPRSIWEVADPTSPSTADYVFIVQTRTALCSTVVDCMNVVRHLEEDHTDDTGSLA